MTTVYHDGSPIQFTPDASRRWVVDVTPRGLMKGGAVLDPPTTLVVIGWAVVAGDPGNERGLGMETSIQPVAHGFEDKPMTENEFGTYENARCAFSLRYVEPDEWVQTYQKWVA